MLRIVKVGGLTLGAGVLVGLGAVGWMQVHRQDAPVVNSKGGSVVLDANTSPTPTPAGNLGVLSPSSVAAAGGGASTLLGGTKTAESGPPAPGSGTGDAKGAPGPSEFHQYDAYAGETRALFGDVLVGTGKAVAAGSEVTVNYRGWLTDGRLFEETYSAGKPLTFVEGAHKVIPGWEEAIFGMKAGGKRRLIIPPARGYGADAHDPIPANSVLVFDVELITVK